MKNYRMLMGAMLMAATVHGGQLTTQQMQQQMDAMAAKLATAVSTLTNAYAPATEPPTKTSSRSMMTMQSSSMAAETSSAFTVQVAPSAGSTKWQAPLPTGATIQQLCQWTNGTIYCVNSRYVTAYATNGTQLWNLTLPYTVPGSVALADDGTGYVVDIGANLTAFDVTNGTIKWQTNIPNASGVQSVSVAPNGTLYWCSHFTLISFNPVTRMTNWMWTPPSDFRTGPGGFYIFDYTTPLIGQDGTVFVGTANNWVLALTDQGTNAVIKWSQPGAGAGTGGAFQSHGAIGSDGTVYYGDSRWGGYGQPQGYLYAFNPVTGAVKWSYPLTDYLGQTGPGLTVGRGDTVYVQTVYGVVTAVRNGVLVWTTTVPTMPQYGVLLQNSVTIGADGTLYLNAGDGTLTALNEADGSVLWKTGTIGQIPGGLYPDPIFADLSVLVGTNGAVYDFGHPVDAAPYLLCIAGSGGGPAPWAWPNLLRNARGQSRHSALSLTGERGDHGNFVLNLAPARDGTMADIFYADRIFSTNAVIWTNLGTVKLKTAGTTYSDPFGSNAARFYKIVAQ